MWSKLEKLEARYAELIQLLSDSRIVTDPAKLRDLAKEQSSLAEIVEKFRAYKQVLKNIDEDKALRRGADRELKEVAELELEELEEKKQRLEEELKALLLPKDPEDSRNAIVEIRAGTGGDEAGLFAGDLYRMYARYAERQGWRVEVMNSNPQGIGGFKEVIFLVHGKEAYGKLKYESGVHRVQRVPITEASGRIHTSAASVVVLPEAEELEIDIKPQEVRIDVYRSSGPGGQGVNTTDSAVRITHLPTGMVVTCQDERSQHKNRAKALKILQARLLEKARQEEEAKIGSTRRMMIGTGDRSEKIRTYNFPQNRVTDHRIGLTLYRLDEVLDGNLGELIEQLHLADQAEKLKKAG